MAENVLFIMSDEHSREIAGCYGNTIVRTPNLDALAARGAVFENAYCNSPICVPSRASLATGDYVHRTGYWDSAAAYDGRVPSWHHRVREAGHDMVSIGKLHYRSPDDDCGFTEVRLPMYIVDGIGDTHGLLRRHRRVREVARELAREAGRGMSVYTRYDTRVADATVRWLRERGERRDDGRPWVLFSSMVSPHYPLIAPDEFYDLYAGVDLPRPRLHDPADRPGHPAIDHYRATWNYDDHFDEERLRSRAQGVLRTLLLPRLPARPDPRRPRRERVRRGHPRHLHLRPRREPRQPGPVGKVRHVRGVERRPDADCGAGHRRRNAVHHSGLPRGCLPHGGRVRLRGARRARTRAPRREPRRARPGAAGRTASSSARCTTTVR